MRRTASPTCRPSASKLQRPVVYHLLGRLSASPTYVISDEDTLEFVCALQSEHLTPEKLFHELEHNHLLFIGSSFTNWLARLFLRMAKRHRLSDPRDVGEVLADNHSGSDGRLMAFLQQVSVRTRIYSGAEKFVDELHRRWTTRHRPAEVIALGAAPQRFLPPEREMPDNAVFISYAREDLAAVQKLKAGLDAAGDQDLVRPGAPRRRRRLRPQDPAQHRALLVLHPDRLGDDRAPARGLLPPRVELRDRPRAQHRRWRALHPAGVRSTTPTAATRRCRTSSRRCTSRGCPAARSRRSSRAACRICSSDARAVDQPHFHAIDPTAASMRIDALRRGQARSQAAVDPQHPWLGLASFTEETRAYFYGREEEVAELGRRVQRKLLTILFGQSGLGKTSILRAGIVPRLRPEGYCPVYVRIDYSPDSPAPSEQIKQAIFRATQALGPVDAAGRRGRRRIAVGVPAPSRRRAARRVRQDAHPAADLRPVRGDLHARAERRLRPPARGAVRRGPRRPGREPRAEGARSEDGPGRVRRRALRLHARATTAS